MPYESFSDPARKVMMLANQIAQGFNHELIYEQHIFLALIGMRQNPDYVVLRLGLNLDRLKCEVEKTLQQGPEMITMGMLPRTDDATKLLEQAEVESKILKHTFVGLGHLFLAFLQCKDRSVGGRLLYEAGLRPERIKQEIASYSREVEV